MSARPAAAGRVTVPWVRARRGRGRQVWITAYDAPTAALADGAGVDVILVGDSVANVVLGYENTLPVTMDEMVHHVRAARRGTARALLVADLPFASYQAGPADAVRNAGRFLKAGAEAVKLEGGAEVTRTVAALARAGMPVVGHLGLTPQRIREFGGYRGQGKTAVAAYRIWEDARALERAGAFAVVLECVPAALAGLITGSLGIPTIGIGAGPDCDGQVLVFHDVVGLTERPPRFAPPFADGRETFRRGLAAYARGVRTGRFPAARTAPELPAAELAELRRLGAARPA